MPASVTAEPERDPQRSTWQSAVVQTLFLDLYLVICFYLHILDKKKLKKGINKNPPPQKKLMKDSVSNGNIGP